MNIIACYKVVPEEQDIVVLQDRSLSFARAEWKIGQYDLNAVEAGVRIAEDLGGRISALSVGAQPLENSKLKKGVLSRGPEELYLVVDSKLENADTHLTAQTLAAAIRKIGACDLILCGEGSGDLYAQQVGAQLGELLNLSCINGISKITLQDNTIIAERTLENEVEVLEIPLPAVISVTTDINLPRIPSMKNILAAGKKPVTQWDLSALELQQAENKTQVLSTLAPEQVERKQLILEGESEEVIQKLFENIRKELL
ncbi:Electron transfer flavoprotein alpha/beta-subunit [Desulfitobacterium hafniense DCB-2]|uniref:Electron transfer flavoprotein small subunit n=1 Tax=Desulfitobacterium hafniense (strain DSM 10664 / DCB-2) TaxID=272564 RepID=B8FXK6_DESHD|nr:electron transfer flavoprotein [Desulfitobacterium hafniense]ACL22607.1 Electron transfer flavoprotein alpha/beta-subunit [Desulfitobacterium hafniense DCB-2]